MRILITGSRYHKDSQMIEKAIEKQVEHLDSYEDVVIIQGECPYGGAVKYASDWARNNGAIDESYPADFKKLGKKAGPLRNQEMVDSGAEVCLAFPEDDSRGTWDCVRKAKKAGIPVKIYK